jgi:protein SCO1/2
MPSRAKVLFAVLILVVAMAVGTVALFFGGWRDVAHVTGTGTALVGGPFTLTDHTGRKVTDADFRGKYMLIFFGYTYCPDVCPTELQVMAEALKQLGPRGESITPVFISIDPERDTPEILKSYVENFDPRLVGLTGTPDETAAVAKAYRAYYAKAGKTESPDYLMDHSSIIYLMDRQGRFLKHFTYTTDAKALAEGLLAAMAASP